MRFLEISCLLFCLLAILSLGSQYPKLQKGLLTLSVVALALHLGIEGWRWQMVPVYVAISLLIFMTIRQTEVSGMLIGSKIAVLMLLSVPLFMLPIPSYPELSGAASVGTDSFDVVDNERGRVLPTKVWFPIDKPTLTKTAELQSAPWLEHQEKIGPVLARIAAMPGFIFNHLRHFKNGYKSDLKLAVANDKPLIVLSHGRGGIKEMNGFMAMEFASQGYIVIAPDHTKGAMYTVLQNGSEIPFDPKEFAEGENLPDPEYDQRIRELGQRWVQDLAVVTSYVQQEIPELANKQVISGGHSTGGGTAIEFCNQDARCIGAIGLDAWMLPIAEETLDELNKPLLSFFGDSRLEYFEPINRERFVRLQQASNKKQVLNKEFVIANANHIDFCDAGLLSPYSYLFGQDKGKIKTQRVMQIINQHSITFAEAIRNNAADKITWQHFPEEMNWGE